MFHLVLGPMFAGKSLHGIRETHRERAIGLPVLMVVHEADAGRYGDELAAVRTHAGQRETGEHVLRAGHLMGLFDLERFQSAGLVCIDEVQFFPDLLEFVRRAERLPKVFVLSGLDGDADRRPFGHTLDILPYCDTVTKLSAYCMLCRDRTLAPFTLRTVASTGEHIQVGGADRYQAVCREHYLLLHNVQPTTA